MVDVTALNLVSRIQFTHLGRPLGANGSEIQFFLNPNTSIINNLGGFIALGTTSSFHVTSRLRSDDEAAFSHSINGAPLVEDAEQRFNIDIFTSGGGSGSCAF